MSTSGNDNKSVDNPKISAVHSLISKKTRWTRWCRWSRWCVCLAVIFACSQCGFSRSSVDPGYHKRPHSTLHWHHCFHGHPHSDCSFIQVPLDYAHPDGKTINIGISRLKATNPRQRIGVLFINPGGPGGVGDQGLGMVDAYGLQRINYSLYRQVRDDYAAVREHFDIIGFDPRGTEGRGDKLHCSIQLVPAPKIVYPPETPQDFARQKKYARELATACKKETGTLIDHIDARSIVNDMDAIRVALGEDRISYFGQSYGTLFGQLYAEKYPTHLRAMVLDGNEDHAKDQWALFKSTAESLENDLHYVNRHCKDFPTCTIPGHNILPYLDKLLYDSEHGKLSYAGITIHPVTIVAMLRGMLFTPMYPENYAMISALVTRQDIMLANLAESEKMLEPQYHIIYGIAAVCHDFITQKPSFIQYHHWLDRLKKLAPHMYRYSGLMFNSSLYCANWPITAQDPPEPLHISPTVQVLLVSDAIDPATPKANSESLHQQIPSSKLIVTDAVGHCTVGNSHCGRVAIARYLITAVLPPHDGNCSG